MSTANLYKGEGKFDDLYIKQNIQLFYIKIERIISNLNRNDQKNQEIQILKGSNIINAYFKILEC